MNSNDTGVTRSRSVWVAIISVIVLLAAFMAWSSFRSAQSMSTAAASDEDAFTRAAPGDAVKLVVEIEKSTAEGVIQGKLLQKQTEKIYLRTSTSVTVQSSSQTKMVMGKQEDVRPAAVVHVTGTLKKDRSVDATQIVILTGYVDIK